MRHFEQPNFSIHTQFNAQTGSLAWLTAYRVQADEHFRIADIDGLGLLVPHLMQALGFNYAAHLGKLAATRVKQVCWGEAITDLKGWLCALDTQFAHVLKGAGQGEFSVGSRLPADLVALVEAGHCGRSWRCWGRQLAVRWQIEHGLMH